MVEHALSTHRVDAPAASPRLSPGTQIVIAAAQHRSTLVGTELGVAQLLLALFERPSRSIQTWLTDTGRDRELLIDEIYATRSASSDGERFELSRVLAGAGRHAAANEQGEIGDLHLLRALTELDHPVVQAALDRSLTPVAPIASTPSVNGSHRLGFAAAMLAPLVPGLGTTPAARRAPFRGDLTALRRAVAPSPIFIALVVTAIGSAAALVIDSGYNHLKPLVIAFVASSRMVSQCMYEFGHAAAAFLAGDRSGRARGYLTLDPRRYTNPLLSIALPALMLPAGRVPLPGGLVFVDDSAIRTPSARNASSASPVLL